MIKDQTNFKTKVHDHTVPFLEHGQYTEEWCIASKLAEVIDTELKFKYAEGSAHTEWRILDGTENPPIAKCMCHGESPIAKAIEEALMSAYQMGFRQGISHMEYHMSNQNDQYFVDNAPTVLNSGSLHSREEDSS